MKKPSSTIIKSYSIAIMQLLNKDIKNFQIVLMELNQILNFLFNAGLLSNCDYNQVCNAVLKTNLNSNTKNIIKVLCSQKRLDCLKFILESLISNFRKISDYDTLIIYSSEDDFKTICEYFNAKNDLKNGKYIIFHNFIDYRNNLIIKINDRVMDFSIESCVNKMKSSSIKLVKDI
jgi:F0F1-type ATP synthase delta subunit